MPSVRPKKRLGQHFLKDQGIARKITQALGERSETSNVLEIGPGTGVLSDFLMERNFKSLILMDLDSESVDFLVEKINNQSVEIIYGDFLKSNLTTLFDDEPFAIIGNFPYNISAQIFFKILENRKNVTEVVGMIQKEVAERIVSKEGNKTYGILSVLLQAYFDLEYLFSVPASVFIPPPKVESAVIRLKRNQTVHLDCDEKLFVRVVKAGFHKRRKTLRNALKGLNLPDSALLSEFMPKRAEQLSVADFVQLTQLIQQ